jgi:hypothetical protein
MQEMDPWGQGVLTADGVEKQITDFTTITAMKMKEDRYADYQPLYEYLVIIVAYFFLQNILEFIYIFKLIYQQRRFWCLINVLFYLQGSYRMQLIDHCLKWA